MDSGNILSLGYEPSRSSFKFAGSKDAWPAFRWQFLATINSFGEHALDVLENKYDDVVTKKGADLVRVKTEAKGDQDAKAAIATEVDKMLFALPDKITKIKNKVLYTLVNSLSGRAITLVQSIKVDDPHAIWVRLKTEYEGSGSGASIMALYQQAATIRHDAGSSLSTTIAKFDDIHRRMVDKKESPSNNYRVGQLLACLPSSYDSIKAAMNALEKEWTWQEAIDRLLAHQEQSSAQATRRQKPIGEAYAATTTEGRQVTCFNCQKPGHISYDCPSKTISVNSHRAVVSSSRGRGGQRSRGRGGRGRGVSRQQVAAAAETAFTSHEVAGLYHTHAMLSANDSDDPPNILDSGCTTHLKEAKMFANFSMQTCDGFYSIGSCPSACKEGSCAHIFERGTREQCFGSPQGCAHLTITQL